MKALGMAVLCFAVCLPAMEVAAERVYRNGQSVFFRGQVVGGDGLPIAEVGVVLEVSRSSFKLLRLRRAEKQNPLQVVTQTDGDGRYSIEWPWNDYYNTFELLVAVPVSGEGREDFEVFYRLDISERTKAGSPIEVLLTVDDSEAIEWLQTLFSGQAKADPMRVFQEMGRPDRLDEIEVAGAAEASWWYFAAGKVYRFRQGALVQVEHFEPLAPLD